MTCYSYKSYVIKALPQVGLAWPAVYPLNFDVPLEFDLGPLKKFVPENCPFNSDSFSAKKITEFVDSICGDRPVYIDKYLGHFIKPVRGLFKGERDIGWYLEKERKYPEMLDSMIRADCYDYEFFYNCKMALDHWEKFLSSLHSNMPPMDE